MTITIDLHVHTNASDGTMTPGEVVEYAAQKGLEAIAITDHDTVEGIGEALDKGRDVGLEVLPGLEISVECPYGVMHLLGYFIDMDSPFLMDRLTFLQKARLERNSKICEKLADLGIKLDYEKVIAVAGEGQIGRLHFSRAMTLEGYTRSVREAFVTYLKKGAPAYVDKFRLKPEEAIGLILDSKGIPVMAHPCTLGDLQPGIMEEFIRKLVRLGLKGLEVYYPDHTDEHITLFKHLAGKYGLFPTGGSDFHGENKPGVEMGVFKGGANLSRSLINTLKQFNLYG